jgi:hypothetical protein
MVEHSQDGLIAVGGVQPGELLTPVRDLRQGEIASRSRCPWLGC